MTDFLGRPAVDENGKVTNTFGADMMGFAVGVALGLGAGLGSVCGALAAGTIGKWAGGIAGGLWAARKPTDRALTRLLDGEKLPYKAFISMPPSQGFSFLAGVALGGCVAFTGVTTLLDSAVPPAAAPEKEKVTIVAPHSRLPEKVLQGNLPRAFTP